MNLRRISIFLLLCVAIAQSAVAASPDIVISQVYGGGGAGTGTPAYTNDYVELFNTSSSAVVIGGRSIQYGSSTGVFGGSGNIFTFPAGTTIPAGGYLLVKTGATGALGAPFTADFTTGGLSMAAASGKVALVTTSTALGCGATATPCTLPDARIIDSVAWGASNNGEGGTTVNNGSALNSSLGGIRKSNGCQDTDNNNADFIVATTGSGLVPRTSASAPHSCGVTNNPPTITAPADPAATVTQDAAPFAVNLTGNDDGGVYSWSATAGSGVSSVNVTAGQGTANVTFTVTLQAGFTGTATFSASLSDTVNPAVSQAVNIQVNPLVANDPPTIAAPANPIATVAQDAAPFAVNLSGSDDNNVFNWSATAGAGVSSVVSGGQGTATAAFTVTLQPGFSGTANFTASLSDGVTAPDTQLVNITVTPAPPPPLDHMVISQIYGGGGNSGATYRNDYVELYNASTTPFDLGGWTIQYASATGTSWQAQPLGGIVQPGEYYLIALASGGAVGATLPLANVDGSINMSATAGKVALVSSGDPLEGGCPLGDATLVDLVGFGTTATCREGATNAPGGNNTTAMLRKNGGFTDTNVNGADFVTGAPNPRRTTPIVEIGPYVLSTDPRNNAGFAPRDANISVTFTEPVDAAGNWYDIVCVTTGSHNDATVAVVPGNRTWVIVPNVNFLAGEQCTLTVFKNNITDQDLDDSGVNTDTLTANYTWTFSIATGTAPEYAPDVHLTFGNPSDAETDLLTPNNYLMLKPELALSYNRSLGTANWVSWHLDDTWTGFLSRVDTFRADPAVPPDWYRVLSSDYFASGFDRGHMVPNADRNPETSIPINQATFLMTNMIPQSPDNNQGPWADLENFLRTLLPANEVYIVAGGSGIGGTGSNGFATTIANGNVTVPAQTWKVALVLPKDGGDDVSRVTAGTRTIAVIMPNIQGIRNIDWTNYLTTVDAVEALTGYDLFENVGNLVENGIEAGVNGANPPGVEDQSESTVEDESTTFTLDSVSPNSNPLTYTIVSGPSYGSLSGTDATRTYTPAPDFNGTDTFTFRVSNGALQSILATVTITVSEVNDAPSASNDAKSTNEDVTLQFAASELAANDSAGPANESTQTLTVSNVTATGDTHGVVTLASGQVTYAPDANYHGPASFSYEVCDNGTTAGLTSSLCSTATVHVTVNPVNDAPVVTVDAPSTSAEGTAITATATVSDVDANESFTYTWTVTKNGSPFASGSSSSIGITPDDDGAYAFSVVVTDAGNDTGNGSATTSVTNVAPAIASVSGPSASLSLGAPATVSVSFTDAGAADTHTATFSWDDGSTSTATCAAGTCTATRTYAAAGVYSVAIVVADDDGGADSATFRHVIVTDASAGFITGGGWIATASGQATLNVNAKYVKNQSAPIGNTQFQAAGVNLTSTSYDWLVVSGANAQVQGTGTVNGASGFAFLVVVTDGSPDKFRIRIWNTSTNVTVYDTLTPQDLGGGNITIHH